MDEDECYLSLKANAAVCQNNGTAGISNQDSGAYLRAFSTIQNPAMPHPVGLYVEMVDSDFSHNYGDGLLLQGLAGIVGGAWRLDPNANSNDPRIFINDQVSTIPNYPPSLDPDWGQGVLDRLRIHHNGGHGIFTTLGITTGGAASVRDVNDMIWANALEGYKADVPGGLLLEPLVQCTVVGNGEGANPPANMEIIPPSPVGNVFGRQEPDRLHPGQYRTLETKIWNSIFQRKNSATQEDFGPNLQSLVVYEQIRKSYDSAAVLFRGGRVYSTPLANTGDSLGTDWFTTSPIPFVGPVDWTSDLPDPFFIDSGSVNYSSFTHSPDYLLPLDVPESSHDYLGNPRPLVTTGDRDKGAQTKP